MTKDDAIKAIEELQITLELLKETINDLRFKLDVLQASVEDSHPQDWSQDEPPVSTVAMDEDFLL